MSLVARLALASKSKKNGLSFSYSQQPKKKREPKPSPFFRMLWPNVLSSQLSEGIGKKNGRQQRSMGSHQFCMGRR